VKDDSERTEPPSEGSQEVPKEQGPVVEEVAQADRVREELFHENEKEAQETTDSEERS
jgi:hypothetical protein